MDDLIKRQDAIEAIEQLWDWDTVDGIQTSTALKQVITDIKNLPSAQQWIPCSERLPKEDDLYLVTNSRWGYSEREIGLWQGGEWLTGGEPIAWMPLPEPWKGEQK